MKTSAATVNCTPDQAGFATKPHEMNRANTFAGMQTRELYFGPDFGLISRTGDMS